MDVPKDIDVILVAPKGSGRTVRSLFREGRGINSSIAIFQDVTGKAQEKAIAMGVAIGSGYLYQTTFEKEVYSDLYGERGCLMGGIHGMFLAQYEVLRERGHSPSEAFNETVEEATQSLYPLIGANGMDYMYEACSTTARRGAIDWSKRFRETLKPLFSELYNSVRDGTETKKSLEFNSRSDYRQAFEKEMEEIRGLEIWRAGKAVRYVANYIASLLYMFANSLAGPFVQRTHNRCPNVQVRRVLIPVPIHKPQWRSFQSEMVCSMLILSLCDLFAKASLKMIKPAFISPIRISSVLGSTDSGVMGMSTCKNHSLSVLLTHPSRVVKAADLSLLKHACSLLSKDAWVRAPLTVSIY